MSVQTLYTAATGMEAMQTKLDVIANNLANINTTGFKKDRANFEDLLYRTEVYPGVQDSTQTPTAVGTQVGLGVRVTSTQTDQRQGTLQQTGRDLDVAIQGGGYFRVVDPSSQDTMYTRAATWTSTPTASWSWDRRKSVDCSIHQSPSHRMPPRLSSTATAKSWSDNQGKPN